MLYNNKLRFLTNQFVFSGGDDDIFNKIACHDKVVWCDIYIKAKIDSMNHVKMTSILLKLLRMRL